MSKFRTIPFAALSATLLAAGGASAQSMSSIDAREAYEQREIDRGIRDGSLTPGEAARLERGMDRIGRYEDRARADGRVSPYERQRLDGMLDREQRSIYRETHDGQRADGRGWGDRGGWRHDRDGWGREAGWNRDRDGWDRGRDQGWARGEHNGWDGNRPPGIERRDARNEQRIHDGIRDGSLTRAEVNQLQRGQDRIDRYEARARSDGVVTPYERNRIEQMQNRESRQIYADRHNDRTAPAAPTAGSPANTGSRNWGGWHTQQASAAPTAASQPDTGSRNWSGFRTQQASATPTAQPRPTMTRASAPAPSTTGGRTWGGRH